MSEQPTCTVHLWIDGPDVCMQVVAMDESLRGKGLLSKDGVKPEVWSGNTTAIYTGEDRLYLRGRLKSEDDHIARCHGDTALLDRIAASIQSIGGVVIRYKPGTEPQPEPAPEPVPDKPAKTKADVLWTVTMTPMQADQIAERREYRIQIDDVNSVDTRGIRFDIDLRLTSAELAELVASLIRKG